MIRLRVVSLLRGLVAATFLAACAAGPGATWTPLPAGPSSSPRGTSSATEAPSTAPTSAPSPDGSAVACASDLPTTLASVDDLADASCYGATDLTIEGWLAETDIFVPPGETDPSWTIPWVALYADSPTIGDAVFDLIFAERSDGGKVFVVSPSDRGTDLSGTGRWVTATGHFNDPTAAACRVITTDDDENEPECDRLFVVSTLEALERPDPVCPTASPLPLATYLAADATCFGGDDVSIAAWEAVGEGFGGFAPVYPITYEPPFSQASAQLASGSFEGDGAAPFIFVWTAEGSDVTFDGPEREVLVTGHLRDAAASQCVPGPYPAWTWAPPASWAQHRCERLFVITAVSDRT